MLDKFLVLLERFVVAHELIAANSAKQPATLTAANNITKSVEIKVEGEDVIDTKAVKGGAKPEPEDDLDDDEEPEEKPKRKPRQAKPKDEPKGPDVAKLREEIRTIAKAIAAGDSDECADKFDELLEDYKVRTVNKLADEDVEAFHKDATKLVGKYYEIED
ncbi:TPA: hypothetical protein P2303_004671 [Salmonella enterica subsp. enterica serovar Typhimurium]|nr:hypothetical protein [Salmonella enterica subsp. enterica serovar Typhimurium]HDO5626961.1 hypothetical protein [Salmonella enterica subsp. enterica serovar Typhimurium]